MDPERLIKRVDAILADIPYKDPKDTGASDTVIARYRSLDVTDPETGTIWGLSDLVLSRDDEQSEERRVVGLNRGAGDEQLIFQLKIDEDEVVLDSLGALLFQGDIREEFLAGLGIIERQKGQGLPNL